MSLDLPYAELGPGRGGAAGVGGIGWRLLLHKPLVLCANSALYLIFLAYFSVVEIATNHQTTHYWEFATVLLLLSYAGTAIGIVAFIGFRGLVVNGQGRVSEERAQRIKYLLSVVQDSINNVTAGFTFAAVLALCAAAQKTLNLHPTSQYAADPAVFWAYAMWAASASIALIWALQALMLDPLKAAAAASKSGTAAGAGDGARPRSDTGLARYEGLRAEVALTVGQHLFGMTCNTVGYCCAVAFDDAVFKMFWNSAYMTSGPTEEGKLIPGVNAQFCMAQLKGFIETFNASRFNCTSTAVSDDDARVPVAPKCSYKDATDCFEVSCFCFKGCIHDNCCSKGICEASYEAVGAINASGERLAWVFFLASLIFTLFVVTVKHVRRIRQTKSVSTRLKERKARQQRERERAGGEAERGGLWCARLSLCSLGVVRGLWRALMRFLAHTSVWATAVAMYSAIITSVALRSGLPDTLPDEQGAPATRAWFLGPSSVPASQFDLYLSFVSTYTLSLLVCSTALMGAAELALRRFCGSGPPPLQSPANAGKEGAEARRARQRAAAAIARHYNLSALACECVELLSIGLALCIGRAFNALLLTSFRLGMPDIVQWFYPLFCTVLGIALAHVVTRIYGPCARVVKESPGQIVGFASALNTAVAPVSSKSNPARDHERAQPHPELRLSMQGGVGGKEQQGRPSSYACPPTERGGNDANASLTQPLIVA